MERRVRAGEASQAITPCQVTPGDSGYYDARRIWNASVDRKPAVIARCMGTADVVAAVVTRGVSVDPASGRVLLQGGATLGDLGRETHTFGLSVPVGIVPKTGVAGLTLGGGVGWLVRKYGMSIDNLVSCQVVTADGQVRTANAGISA